ncbi:MAG TPA: Wzz/FepE/Etk N-terminal domain-containing protein, partial [Chitinophagaceae bacterium]|nr:Wzz/FepE/Etk N-terminal domain-containing protein [Chitinophagaceae bacterium]
MEQIESEQKQGSFNLQRYLAKVKKKYWWFIITIVLFVAASYVYLNYKTPIYLVSTNILIKQPTEASERLGSPFEIANGDGGNSTNINNEILKLKSARTVGDVVDSLKLYITVLNANTDEGKLNYFDKLFF